MHLSDEQLLDRSQDFSEHLSQCSECSNRLSNLESIRNRFQEHSFKMPVSGSWQRLQQEYLAQQHDKQLKYAQQKTAFWQRVCIGVAASFAMAWLLGSFIFTEVKHENLPMMTQTVKLIARNNDLQEKLTEHYVGEKVDNYKVVSLMIELDVIDKKLQQSYLQDKSDAEKNALWIQRHKVIEAALTAVKQPQTLKI